MPLYRHKYNFITTDRALPRRELEWELFRRGWTVEQGGLGRAGHFKEGFKRTWPNIEFEKVVNGETVRNHWADRMFDAFCNDEQAVISGTTAFRLIVLSGCAAAGKTFSTACYVVPWWCVDPANSVAVVTSTTRDMVRRRIWPVIANLHGTMQDEKCNRINCGHLVDSRMEITYEDPNSDIKDAKHAIFAMAVAHGETKKAEHNLRGMHAPRMLLVIDEANGTPEAIFSVIANWRKACDDLTVIIIGNPVSRLDNHGRAMDPVNGWGSVTTDTYAWATKRVPEWDLDGGIALRFDGADSPNVRYGETIFPYIYRKEDWDAAKSRGENTLAYWVQNRGLHPPEGLLHAVLNESALANSDADIPLNFVGPRTACMFLDPAFGGDEPILVIGECGQVDTGQTGLQINEYITLTIDVSPDADEPDLQNAAQFVALAKQRGIRPENTGLDATGTGRGVYAFVCSLWSKEVFRFEASEKPGPNPVMEGDRRPAEEAYLNAITESWVLVGSLTRTGQMKGMNHEAKRQFTMRQLTEPRIAKGKQRLEDKQEYKKRLGHSPDDADATAGLAFLCSRRHGLGVADVVRAKVERDGWDQFVQRWNAPYLPEEEQPQLPEFVFADENV